MNRKPHVRQPQNPPVIDGKYILIRLPEEPFNHGLYVFLFSFCLGGSNCSSRPRLAPVFRLLATTDIFDLSTPARDFSECLRNSNWSLDTLLTAHFILNLLPCLLVERACFGHLGIHPSASSQYHREECAGKDRRVPRPPLEVLEVVSWSPMIHALRPFDLTSPTPFLSQFIN